jgi:hypothetical protein
MLTDPLCCFTLSIPWPEEYICVFKSTCFDIVEWVHREFEMEMVEVFFVWHCGIAYVSQYSALSDPLSLKQILRYALEMSIYSDMS